MYHTKVSKINKLIEREILESIFASPDKQKEKCDSLTGGIKKFIRGIFIFCEIVTRG
jgi:hypothetical protein